MVEHGLDMESGKIDFVTFCNISVRFMTEEDEEGLREELKEAFRIYDRDGEGFITTDVLKEILREIDSELTEDDLDNIIEEVDEDGSGTLDFDGKIDILVYSISYTVILFLDVIELLFTLVNSSFYTFQSFKE